MTLGIHLTTIQNTNPASQTRIDPDGRSKSVHGAGPFRRLLDEPGLPTMAGPSAAPGRVSQGDGLSCRVHQGQGEDAGDADLERLRDIQAEGRQQNLELIELQQSVQAENSRFSTLSNLLKARHETAKSAINNIRV